MGSDEQLPENIFHRVTHKESEKKTDPLDGLVQELQKRNLTNLNNASCDEKRLNEQREELDLFFNLIMQQVRVASKQEERLLAGRLVNLEKVEKQFGSLLLAQLQATEARIRLLENQQTKLLSAIDQHRSLLGFLFVGMRSRMQLRSVRGQLRILYSQHAELTETSKTFQYARRAILQGSKEKAVSLLERLRRQRVNYVGALLFESMRTWLTQSKKTDKLEQSPFLGFCVEEAHAHKERPQEGFFGVFSKPLVTQEREWIEEICQLHGLSSHDEEDKIKRHLEQFIEEKRHDSTYNLANHLLLLIRLLYIREGLDEESNTYCLALYELWNAQNSSLDAWHAAWSLGGPKHEERLQTILDIIKEIEALHQQQAVSEKKQVNLNGLRHVLAEVFRPFIWKTDNLASLLPKEAKPALFHRKQWQEELSSRCDEAFAWWIAQTDAQRSLSPHNLL